MGMKHPPIQYDEYLHISKLTEFQNRRSVEFGNPAHDEMLFIITHQTYELWFKQILFELDSVLAIFAQSAVSENQMGTAVARLSRIVEIMKLLVSQVTVLETMTPLDFLDFRDLLYPASGFQSVQFRELENKLGLRPEQRLPYNSQPYKSYVTPDESARISKSEAQKSMHDYLEKWLERTPFLEAGPVKFWDLYRQTVEQMLNDDLQVVTNNPRLNSDERKKQEDEINNTRVTFSALFDDKTFSELQAQGQWRMSLKALQAALLINLYRDEPILHLPFRLLSTLQDIDELMTTWRYRHGLMAQRMLGSKIGTGGSSGHRYLKSATEKHRLFGDLFNLATFLIPRSQLPTLPTELKTQLGFFKDVK